MEIYRERYDLLWTCLWIREAACYMDAFRSYYEHSRKYCFIGRNDFICRIELYRAKILGILTQKDVK